MEVRKDIKILVGNELTSLKKCPTTVISNNPCFKWVLPDDLKGRQTRFCLQIKAVKEQVLSSGKVDRAFYQSGNVESGINSFEFSFGGEGMRLQSWRGAIAVRLFISTKTSEETKNEKIPFEYVSDAEYDSRISFEKDDFNIKDDTRYFVFDDSYEKIYKADDIVCSWKNSVDSNNDELTYFSEICESPKFENGSKEVIKFEVKDNKKSYSKLNVSLKRDTEYFFKVRSFDSIDYSEWSDIHGFCLTSNSIPKVEITSLENLDNGNIKINFQVFDAEQKIITLKLLYSGGSIEKGFKAVPVLLESPHVFVIDDENKGCGSLTWLSLENEKNDADDFLLYISANDGIDDSEEFVYGPFSIHNKSILKKTTSGGSYFLTFPVECKLKNIHQIDNLNETLCAVHCNNGITFNNEYFGFNSTYDIFNKYDGIYNFLTPLNSNNFCVKTPSTFYRKIYHHGKYMIYDHDIPSKSDEKEENKDDLFGDEEKNESSKLEKDPYVIATPFNPTLNVDKEGVNVSVVYIEKASDNSSVKNGILPNGCWYNKKEEKKGFIYYKQVWGDKFDGNYGFNNFVFEDNENAPQYTLDPNDLDESGYPKPISYSQYENIGKNTVVYIKKYRVENAYSGNPKNFKVVQKNGKYVREYFSCRGTPPVIVYENGHPFYSYNGVLINKYYPEEKNENENINISDDAIYLHQSIWKKKITYQNVAVPYYVPSTEAIYRPGNMYSGIVGKNEPIVVNGFTKKIEKTYGSIKESTIIKGETKISPRENQIIGQSKSRKGEILLSSDNDVFIDEDNEIKLFIFHEDTLLDYFKRNENSIIQFNKDNVVFYRKIDFEKLDEIKTDLLILDGVKYPYYAYYYIDEENEKNNKIKYFVIQKGFESELNSISTKTIEINKEEKLYYAFYEGKSILLPQDYGVSAFVNLIKKQKYLPDIRKNAKPEEKFDFLDYICKGNLVGEYKMYYAGINGWKNKDVVDDYNRAIKFVCDIKFPDKLQELKIIYLQYYWDSYNKIHWEGNLGVNTYIRIEYTKLINGKEVGWKDLRFNSSVYVEKLNAWLVKPLTFSSLVDNFNYKQFDDECQYRMRISGVDVNRDIPIVIGPVIASPDFYIDNDSINPFVVEGMEFDPWTRILKIKFRVDDLQGDLYDITSIKYTIDEKFWYDISIGDVVGEVSKLKSNTLKNRESNNLIIHTISLNVSGYLQSSAEIRIQIYGTLSEYNVDFDYPYFKWTCWDNQRYRIAEEEENSILGAWVRYRKVYNKNGELVWEELEEPIRQSGGELEVNSNSLNEIEKIYEKYVNSSDNPLSYDDWLVSNFDNDGVSYASKIKMLQSEQSEFDNRLNNAKRLRFEAELFTRKELIKQGFYCNGFENNDHENYPPFEWRVLNLPPSGHASTMEWVGATVDDKGIKDIEGIWSNGDFKKLTEELENINTLKNVGFEITFPIPVGVFIDEESSPARINVYTENSTNYLHFDNLNIQDFLIAEIYIKEENPPITINQNCEIIVFSKKTSIFYFELDSSYGIGEYKFSLDCFTGNDNFTNKLEIYLEQYGKSISEHENNLTSILLFSKTLYKKYPITSSFVYKENNENIVNKTEFSRIVFKCTGDIYISNISFKYSKTFSQYDDQIEYNSLKNIRSFPAIGAIGERKTDASNIGKHLSDENVLSNKEILTDEDKYSVYYRFQLDFQEDFCSQRFGVPLRDIIFANVLSNGGLIDENIEEMSRIKSGQSNDNVILVNKDVTNAKQEIQQTNIEKIIENGKEIETEKSVISSGGNIENTTIQKKENRKNGSLTIQKKDLPGEWKGKKINSSFPNVYEKSNFASGSFNGNYFWRVAAYNVVECNYEEISHSSVEIKEGISEYAIYIYGTSNENIETLKINDTYWYKTKELENPYWEFDWIKERDKFLDITSTESEVKSDNELENKNEMEYKSIYQELQRGLVKFPTDAPRNEKGFVISGNNSIVHVPNSLNRLKPFVIKDDSEFNYYMFYSKPSELNENVIVQSMGKSWDKFGELSQLYPKFVLDSYSDAGTNLISMFSPCAILMSFNKNLSIESNKTYSHIEAFLSVNVPEKQNYIENNSELKFSIYVYKKYNSCFDELEASITCYPEKYNGVIEKEPDYIYNQIISAKLTVLNDENNENFDEYDLSNNNIFEQFCDANIKVVKTDLTDIEYDYLIEQSFNAKITVLKEGKAENIDSHYDLTTNNIYDEMISARLNVIDDSSKFILYYDLECSLEIKTKETLQKKIYVWSNVQDENGNLYQNLFISDVGKVDFNEPINCNGLNNTYHPCVIIYNNMFLMVCCKTNNNKSCLFTYVSSDGINWEEYSFEPILIPDFYISSPSISKTQDGYKIYLTEWIGKSSRIVSYNTKNFKSVFGKNIELNETFEVEINKEKIFYSNPKNPCVIDDMYMGEKVKRMYYNVDVSYKNNTESIIKTMFLETGEWEKSKNSIWENEDSLKLYENKTISSSIWGEKNVILLNNKNELVKNGVRLEIELSDAYKLRKECILQSDWITKDNYIEYDAEISPERNFVYNTKVKDKKYNGE